MSRALPSLPRRWWSIELPGDRPHPAAYATYSAFDSDGLPPIDRALDDAFAWLVHEIPVRGSLAEVAPGDPEPRREATLEQLTLILAGAQIGVPTSFASFIGSAEPRRRIRSATACYLDLADVVVAVAGGGHLIHFLSDQQWVCHWLIFVGPGGSEAVVVTSDPLGYPAEGAPREFDPSTTDAAVCAESFAEFAYRFWIENEIWFALSDPAGARRPLSEEEARYVGWYRRRPSSGRAGR